MAALSHTLPSAQKNAKRAPTLRVVLFGVDRLVPKGVSDDLARAWLSAPVAGRPLHARLLDPLLGTAVDELCLVGQRVAHLLAERLEEDPAYGFRPRVTSLVDVAGDDAFTLLLPGSGLLDLDVRHVIGRLIRAERQEACVTLPIGGDLHAHLLAPGVDADLALASPVDATAREGRILRVDTAARLIAVAREALDRAHGAWAPAGRWDGGVLRGPGSVVSPMVEADMSQGLGDESAVGDGSQVEGSVRFGPGAVIGRNAFVCEGASIANAIVLDDTFVQPFEHLHGVVRWRDHAIR